MNHYEPLLIPVEPTIHLIEFDPQLPPVPRLLTLASSIRARRSWPALRW